MTVQQEIAAAKAIEAARRSLKENRTATELADELKVSRSSVTLARLILEYGTAAELDAASNGDIGLRTLGDTIRERLPPDDRERLKHKTSVYTDARRENIKAQAELWAKLNSALKNLSNLPQPIDVIGVVKSNAMRENAVNAQIDIVAKWMEEFANEWTRYQQAKSEGHTSDPGNGNPTAGSQHPEQAA